MNQEIIYYYHSNTPDFLSPEVRVFKTYESARRAFLADLVCAEDQHKAMAFAEKLVNKQEPSIDHAHIQEWGQVVLETYYGKFPSGAWYLSLEALPLQ